MTSTQFVQVSKLKIRIQLTPSLIHKKRQPQCSEVKQNKKEKVKTYHDHRHHLFVLDEFFLLTREPLTFLLPRLWSGAIGGRLLLRVLGPCHCGFVDGCAFCYTGNLLDGVYFYFILFASFCRLLATCRVATQRVSSEF